MIHITSILSIMATLAAAQPQHPHIIFNLVDDWGFADLGVHNPDPAMGVDSPNFDNFFRVEGAEFNRSYVHQFCSPTRSGVLSGRLPIHVNVENSPLSAGPPTGEVCGGIPRNMTTIAEQLKTAGYLTHAVGKWNVGMCSSRQTPKGRGFDSSLIYFNGENNYYNMSTQDTTCGDSSNVIQIQDFWTHDDLNGIPEGPAYDLVNSPDCMTDLDQHPHPINRPECRYEDQLFADRVLEIIQNHDASQPLFLYFAPHIAHEPLMVPEAYYQQFAHIPDESRRRYLAMVKFQDDVVGDIANALKAKGMWDDTVWFGSSDNGGPIYKSLLGGLPNQFPDGTVAYAGANNWPLRGGKGSNWEGGIRANAWITGGKLPVQMRGQIFDDLVTPFDWYQTACGLAGMHCQDQRAISAGLPTLDSLDLWPYITGLAPHSPRTSFFAGFSVPDLGVIQTTQAIILADYSHPVTMLKLIKGVQLMDVRQGVSFPNSSTTIDPLIKFTDCTKLELQKPGCLFDLRADPGEYVDLSEDPQYIPARDVLLDLLDIADITMYRPMRGQGNKQESCSVAINQYGSFWGPYLP